MKSSPVFSVVIPVYKNEENVSELLDQLSRFSKELGSEPELVFVIDGSPDNSEQKLLEGLIRANLVFKLVVHSRNFGAFAAVRTGLSYASGNYVGVMAADLQEPPELMFKMFKLLSEDSCDIALGVRTKRRDSWIADKLSNLSWAILKKLVFPEMPQGGVDVFACTKKVAKELLELSENNSSLVGQLFWLGYRRIEVPYERLPRTKGKSGWTLSKKIKYFLDSMFSFTDFPIKFLTYTGLIGTLLTFCIAIIVLFAYLSGNISSPGYTPLMLVMLFSTFLIVSGMGILGSYIWRTFENTKQRPLAVVRTLTSRNNE